MKKSVKREVPAVPPEATFILKLLLKEEKSTRWSVLKFDGFYRAQNKSFGFAFFLCSADRYFDCG